MGTVTRLAYSKIMENDLMMNKELDPRKVLDYLRNGNNFKKISDLLKETMIKAGIPRDTKELLKNYKKKTVNEYLSDIKKEDCNFVKLSTDDDIICFSTALFELLKKLENECIYKKRSFSWNTNIVNRWFNGNNDSQNMNYTSSSIREREDAIFICFALGLDFDSTQEFLNKSGHPILNVRNAEDATYAYCLLNNRPLSVAKELMAAYELIVKYGYDKNLDTAEKKVDKENSGNTTQTIRTKLVKVCWEDDDSFLNSFLIPQKDNFISFSKNALHEFLRLKISTYLYILNIIINNDPKQKYALKFKKHLTNSFKDSNLLNNAYSYMNSLKDIESECVGDIKSISAVKYIIENIDYSQLEYDQLSIISSFLSEILSANNVFALILPSMSVNDDDGKMIYRANGKSFFISEIKNGYLIEDPHHIKKERIVRKEDSKAYDSISKYINIVKKTRVDTRNEKTSHSILKDSALKNFPQRQFFTGFENDPGNGSAATLRKAIILLYYLNYIYHANSSISFPELNEEHEYGIDSFIKNLNNILGKCQLGKLYLANQFDWLILACARNPEIKEEDENNLDKILELSIYEKVGYPDDFES